MNEDYAQAIAEYQTKWQALVAARYNKSFFENQRPTALAWKVSDLLELDQRFDALRDRCDQIHFGWIDERWMVTMHLKDANLPWNISIVKLMQCKPGSAIKTGLDHIDFYNPKNVELDDVLLSETDLKWTHETNNPRCKWYSVWFADTEAKLRTDTVLDPCILELQETRDGVLASTKP